jgi:carbamoyl-phosphate synthase small subunit
VTREAALALEDGALFIGEHFGAEVDAEAEVVFNTSMTGYLEVCTDPSYRGQMVVMCHPQIGNYGVAESHRESTRPWVAALLVREIASHPHHWESSVELPQYLSEHGVPGLQGIDTRALVRRLRSRGTMRAVLRLASRDGFTAEALAAIRDQATRVTDISEKLLVTEVSGAGASAVAHELSGSASPKVVLIDYGLKHNIARSLERRGIEPLVLPWDASAEEIMALHPDGVVLSNGPGDPATLPGPVQTVGRLLEQDLPIFGICLGHQIIGRAIGATTSRLGYGHHGGNHPVKELATGRVTVTTQNHEFQVDGGPAVERANFRVSHVNLNDGSIEGLEHLERPVFSVQYHPEGCPGPQDNQQLFDRFAELVRARATR